MNRIGKLEADMINKQNCLDKLHREKIELENALEQEQEALVNKLWKKMDKLETEKKMLQVGFILCWEWRSVVDDNYLFM